MFARSRDFNAIHRKNLVKCPLRDIIFVDLRCRSCRDQSNRSMRFRHRFKSEKRLISLASANVPPKSRSDTEIRRRKSGIHRSLHREALRSDWVNVPDNLSDLPFVSRRDERYLGRSFLQAARSPGPSVAPRTLSFFDVLLIKSRNKFRPDDSSFSRHH